ncbi:MAG: bifunctional phosphopantothenoylcysteine decarboxylase/phosphopantothenate--cysteine ligase CoaBC [Thermotaleaceae bacterium]
MYSDKHVVLGVTGGIAVYKSVDVVSRLRKLGIHVNVIMTRSAQAFVQPLTFQSLSQNYVVTDMFEEPKTWDVEHISLAQRADLFLIAPATANVIGKIAGGIADDMLTTTVMATKAQVLIAPAMNTNMYENPIVQNNIKILQERGYCFIEPASGRLACGDFGKGKLADPEVIVDEVLKILIPKRDLAGKKVLVTAGPTREAIDPVRYITNHSSGKMGYAIAERAAARGAEVLLVSGPTNLPLPVGATAIHVTSSQEMYHVVMEHAQDMDIIIKSAAVADYRPEAVANNKIKKGEEDLVIRLTRNPDILKSLGAMKKENQVLVGFAAETENLVKNAKGKIERKNLDFIVANDLTMEGAGFRGDTNIVTIIDRDGFLQQYEKMTKRDLAEIILDKAKSMSRKE